MFEFDLRGIRIEATANIERYDYEDANSVKRTHYNRNTVVNVHFWEFVICDNLYELAMVKSTLNYFIQAYWKRGTKQGVKIDLATSLEHDNNEGSLQKLTFTAKQRNNIYSLEVKLTYVDFLGNLLGTETYFSAQEVILLDIAISKAVALLSPQVVFQEKKDPKPEVKPSL
jgi:hypothetical protein